MAKGQASACADAESREREGRVARNMAVLFVHLVWRTWDRLPMVRPEFEGDLHRLMSSEAAGMGCTVVAIDGTADHVHVLLRIPTTCSIADIVKRLKGVSSQWVNAKRPGPMPFKWQASYGAFTVSRWDVDKIAGYVRNQKAHHAAGTIVAELEDSQDRTTIG